jgi:hypothetical protein
MRTVGMQCRTAATASGIICQAVHYDGLQALHMLSTYRS